MKKSYKEYLIGFIIGVLVASTGVAYASYAILSSSVTFQPKNSSWEVDNVEDALDDLYELAKNGGGNGSNGFIGYTFDFKYTGSYQEFTVPATGEYKIELWGAQGGTSRVSSSSLYGGYGGYTKGVVPLDKGDILYIYVGEEGHDYKTIANNNGGWNGGGNIHYPYNDNSGANTCTGGGATDIRIVSGTWDDAASLRSRVMVAGAGGGASNNGSSYDSNWSSNGGSGGGLVGNIRTTTGSNAKNYYGNGGTQVSGGTAVNYPNRVVGQNGGFGYGGYGAYSDEGSAGGSGWYGGAGVNVDGGGGGGSSYISGHTGCVAVNSTDDFSPKTGCTTSTTDNECSKSPYGIVFTDTAMIDGLGYTWTNAKGSQTGQPQPDGTTATGHTGNGYARITYLG